MTGHKIRLSREGEIMEYQKSVLELIKTRTSSRSFTGVSLKKEDMQKLSEYIAEINKETTIKAKFLLAQNKNADAGKAVKLGTYGVISGANTFIVGVADKDEKDALTFGYLFEKIVLYATSLGIQTCWLGGTFKKSDFEQNISLSDNEFIPIVSPVGYKKDKPRVFESAMRAVIGADKRKPWGELFFETDANVPLTEVSSGSYAVPLEMVRLGPSASNKQPWRITRSGTAFHFFLSRTKGYGLTTFDMQKNDIGIAKCHFELSANELGLKGSWQKIQKVSAPAEWEYVTSWCTDPS